MFVEQDACGGDLTVNNEDFKIGARGGNGGHSSQFRGSVDEAMLFGTCLSEYYVGEVYYATYNPPPAEAHVDLKTLPSGLVGYWPLDATAEDVSGTGLVGTLVAPEFVTGHWGSAFFFDGDDALVVSDTGRSPLDVTQVLMMAWVMPSQYDVAADRGIVMNKESAYEFGLEDASGRLQGAFGPGCWRWWGTVSIPLDVWTHVAAGAEGTFV